MRKLLGALLCAIVTFAILGVAHPVAAEAADAGAEAQFLSSINNIRAQHGLGPLALYGELTGIARDWSDQMAGAGAISHNPNYTGEVSANWTKLGENVGVGYDVPGLMNAFVNSPAHYHNIVDPAYNYIGIGVSYGADGRMYTTHDFMSLADAPAPQPEPAPQPDPTPAPVASAPTQGTSNGPGTSPATSAPTEAPAAPAPVPAPSATPVRVAAVLAALRAVDA
jgi:hypothetical protein